MKTKFIIFTTTTASLLAACGGVENEAKTAVLARLKDPDSAKFGKFTQADENNACLTVNARNSMGGYVGNQQASLVRKDGKWFVIDIEDISHEMCVNTMVGAVTALRKIRDISNQASTRRP